MSFQLFCPCAPAGLIFQLVVIVLKYVSKKNFFSEENMEETYNYLYIPWGRADKFIKNTNPYLCISVFYNDTILFYVCNGNRKLKRKAFNRELRQEMWYRVCSA